MQKNRTTYPTRGQAVANDGLLAGRELESDAELIALGWLKPTNLFEGEELPAIYPEDDAQNAPTCYRQGTPNGMLNDTPNGMRGWPLSQRIERRLSWP